MSTEPEFEPSGLVVIRTPLLPVEELDAWSADLKAPRCGDDEEALRDALPHDRALLRRRLQELLERPEVREAIFLASPDLAESLAQWQREPEGKKGQRTEHGLVRYFLRMTSRSTPFGLFSGCTSGSVGERTAFALDERRSYERHSRLDMDYLFALCELLGQSRETRAEILYRPNSSLYEVAGRLRYAEARLVGRLRKYHLVAVDSFDALQSTIDRAAKGARLGDLAAALVADDPDQEITLEDAEEFLHDLVDNQILLPDLALPVTGEESTPGLLRQLADLSSAAEARELLARTERALADIDAQGLGSAPDRYREIARDLEPLGAPVEMSRLFQVDMVKPAREVTLGQNVIDEVLRSIQLLHRLSAAKGDGPLGDFRTAFKERYGEGREMPLLEVLDEEGGIGFERSRNAAAEASPLLTGLFFQPRSERTQVTWSAQTNHMLRRLAETLSSGRTEMELTEADLAALEARERSPLPDALHVMGALIAGSREDVERGDFRLLFENAVGPSGAKMLGRFCHADERICAGVQEHLAAEEAFQPNALFAEIVHLPAGRIGNILARPVLRGYEIPFLGRSGAPGERQIPADDLLVTVIGDRARLRSKSLGREILPRLTTAHNTANESLGLYRFLASLQGQGRERNLLWGWGPMESLPFLPRVVSGRLVLARARWRLRKDDLKPLVSATGAARYRAAQEFRRERRIPRLVTLVEGDNELLLDFENVLGLDSVIELVKSREEILLSEVLPAPGELCAEGPEGRFFHEFVIPFVRRRPAAQPAPAGALGVPEIATPTVRRSFAPGSEWLYAKIYTGTGTADQILRDEIGPIAREAIAAGDARSWFFIRYGDPEWHLRVRFRGEPDRLRDAVLPRLADAFDRLLESGAAWKLQLDTYDREIERYGGDEGMELSEELFFHDSEAVVEMIDSLTSDAGADARWRLILVGMDRLLDDFGYDLETRLRMCETGRAGFASRYKYEESLRTPIADRMRQERAALGRLLADPGSVSEASEDYQPGLAALERRSQAHAGAVRELKSRLPQPVLDDIVRSYVHMFVNRLSRSAGPEHELVLYDFLVQLYSSQIARARAAAKAPRPAKEAARTERRAAATE